ncbi:hypothetical protein FAM6012_01420 [Lacticaseibacillus paracasei]|uniref:Uncharacterized protein n=1 Tax=Lacticaseibacillus paracasei TaxID=1597 RepID=A0A8B3GWH4_LACPA|nr:hypothetical protein FAM6012_01420 [Lacticaseibacillus paracasei]
MTIILLFLGFLVGAFIMTMGGGGGWVLQPLSYRKYAFSRG